MRINCGGFELNENDFELNGVTLSLKNGGGGGGGLPEVTAEDNGDVLMVVDGEWAKAAGGGSGANVLIVNADLKTNTIDLDKTAGEIVAAMQTGSVIVKMEVSGESLIMPIVFASFNESKYTFGAFGSTDAQIEFSADGPDEYPAARIMAGGGDDNTGTS